MIPFGLRGKSTYTAGDSSSIPGSGRSAGGGHGNPLQCSCLENPVDRGAWGWLQSVGSQKVRHDGRTDAHYLGRQVVSHRSLGAGGGLWLTLETLGPNSQRFGSCVCITVHPREEPFTSVAQSCPTMCNPGDCSTPGLPVHHQLPELAQSREE